MPTSLRQSCRFHLRPWSFDRGLLRLRPRSLGRAARRGLACGLPLALALALALAAARPARAAAGPEPFRAHLHAIRGRILQVWPLAVADCPDGSTDLLVLSSEGGPPAQVRFATFLPCGSALVPGAPRIVVRRLPDAAVLVDVARIPGRAGPQLLSVSAAGIRIESLEGDPLPLDLPIPGGLPLPPRPWEIGRMALVDDWNDDGRIAALVPALTGAWLVALPAGTARRIEMPVYASYQSYMPFLPETVWKWLVQEVSWPTIARGDDDGDGRRDLFALSRWSIWIYHAGADGLPTSPSRKLDWIPFDEETERRPGSTAHNLFARDLDGDTRADLVLNTIEGGLTRGRSTTRFQLGGAGGVSLDTPPTAVREQSGGFSSVDFVDLEGDGVSEILETSFEFGILQLIRLLVTQRAETTVRILRLDPTSPGGVRTLFEDRIALALDFENSRVVGLVPGFGDLNGDGQLDLFVGDGDDSIRFRLGSRRPGAPLLGSPLGRQSVPLSSGSTRAADLNGDGLDDLVAFTTTEPGPPLLVLENLGRLPGTPTRMGPR
ncbi:MAG: VCBS repeat-containing protein [Myxococcota bacterium]